MDFFCAIPKSTPINADGVNTFASFGPYYIASRQVGRQIILKENPNYHGPRPHNVNTFAFTVNTNLDQSLLQVKAGQADYDAGGLPPTAHAALAQQFGINKGRYFVSGWPEHRLRRAEHLPPDVLEGRAAEGGAVRDRPPGDGSPARLSRRSP